MKSIVTIEENGVGTCSYMLGEWESDAETITHLKYSTVEPNANGLVAGYD